MTPELARYLRPCRRRRAKHDSGPRQAAWVRLIVLHSTEGGSASSNAAYFATSAQASTQLVVDERECYRCLPDLVIPWGAPGANRAGLHVEHCAYAAWTHDEWLAHEATLRRSAAKVARWCWQYRIPRRFLTVPELQAGKAGLCRHLDASLAFPPNDGHSDPGHGFPRELYLTLVRGFYRELAVTRAVP